MPNEFDTQISQLASKYSVTASTVNEILVNYIVEVKDPYALQKLDWKDLDAVVQEGLAEAEMMRRRGR